MKKRELIERLGGAILDLFIVHDAYVLKGELSYDYFRSVIADLHDLLHELRDGETHPVSDHIEPPPVMQKG